MRIGAQDTEAAIAGATSAVLVCSAALALLTIAVVLALISKRNLRGPKDVPTEF